MWLAANPVFFRRFRPRRGGAVAVLARALPLGLSLALSLPSGAAAAQSDAVVTAAQDKQNHYDSLIRRARAGETAPALQFLRQLGVHGSRSASRSQQFDHIVVAEWAGLVEEVLAVYERLPLDAQVPPPAVQQAVARAYRDLARWPEALTIWRAGISQYPEQPEAQTVFAAGFILTLVDAGQGAQAVDAGREWTARFGENADLRLALAYALNAQGQVFEALHQTDLALQHAGQSPWVQREYMLALRRAGLVHQALARVEQNPDLYTAAQRRALQVDVAALQTRLAATPSRNEAERFAAADRALARYDALAAEWQALGAQAADDLTRIRIDRLGALHARVRMAEVAQGYEALLADGVRLPRWALTDIADAYLYLRQPERAAALYGAVVAELEAVGEPAGELAGEPERAVASREADPQADLQPTLQPTAQAAPRRVPADDAELLENRIGLMHALIEAERHGQAAPRVTQIAASQPPLSWLPGQPEPLPNERWLDAQVALTAAHLADDDTVAAQTHLETLVARAPNNTNLRADLAGLYRVRAQPRRAEVELKLAEALTPRAEAVEAGQAHTALALQEWQQAEELTADLVARFPERLTVARLARLWEVHNQRELRVAAQSGLVSDSPVAGHGGLSVDTALYTQPIAYHWRGFAGLGAASGRYAEGRGHHVWQRGGLEWRRRDWWVEGDASMQRYGHGAKPGLRLAATHELDDYWQIGGEAALRSLEAPLRALRSGISADRYAASLRWRGNERREWRLDVSETRFGDGNQRHAINLNGRERFATSARWRVDMLFDVATQFNSGDAQRPYYNPKRDLLVLSGVRATQVLYRHYESVWEHALTLAAGGYRQVGSDAAGVFGLTYGQRWRYNDVLDLGASLALLSRPYDGRRERELHLLFDLNFRF